MLIKKMMMMTTRAQRREVGGEKVKEKIADDSCVEGDVKN